MVSVLLVNDDGPPGPESPYVYGLFHHLTHALGWTVKVVLPSSQKSWIGKAYHITEITKGGYYYPCHPDGKGNTSAVSRPLKEGESAEWILLDGTPATCANIALHNLYPGQIDLVISGPNFGRNSSAAFTLSSGTIGAAMSSALSGIRSIAVSYGNVLRPTPTNLFEPAHVLSGKIIQNLWEHWGEDPGGLRNGEVDLYNVNIPMIQKLLDKDGLVVYWTNIWRNSYQRLFKPIPQSQPLATKPAIPPPGPDTLAKTESTTNYGVDASSDSIGNLAFKFAPDIQQLITPAISTIPIGSDGWAIAQGAASITALRASFAEADTNNASRDIAQVRTMKL
ncbi:sure-like protein [Coniophora puteana RWD-64-598 SS2]|uniref:Sure-like protein n=1 Tax=Coniophora puteana (strain RWD-64-598) TaxID=741705 RepID=A0A5M3N765_CONPW|nr:sure-like protein [Coniophora puteana RWD-64-598 SS2]EIW86685.1 sure-like protein [Coniophora puteana RWD-64-598 SS2]